MWCSFYKIHITDLESVQRRFLKFLFFMKHKVYPVRGYDQIFLLTEFEFISLEHRRKQAELIFLYKIIHSLINCPSILSLLNFQVPRLASRNPELFHYDTPHTLHHNNSPIISMSRSYNDAVNLLDIFNPNLTAFKRSITQLFNI